MTCNQAGQLASTTYPGTAPPAQRTTVLAYAHGDLISVTDPLGRVSTMFTDAAGRVLASTDPLGYRTTTGYDPLGNLTSVTDARGKTTSFSYDENSNLTRITDALTNQTNFTYFASNLLQTRTDGLNRSESFAYDLKGNMTLWTDRKNQVTECRYNAYDRPTFIGYNRQGSPGSYTYESTLTLGYDGGWRMTSVADSTAGAGTITRGYDDLDRLTSDQQPQGTVSYTYWADDRRKTMTAGNQAVTSYGYFPNGLLQQISRGTATVGFTYFPSGLPQVTTLPSGVTETYGYSDANELTQIAYAQGTNLGTIGYGYDPAGRRSTVFDTWAQTGLPAATTTNAVYDAANQITSWNGTANAYDANGNTTAAGTQTFAWNARNQLIATPGGTASFVYDGLGRRIKKVLSGTTKLLYDGLNPVQEQNNAGTVTSNLITGLGLDQTFQRSLSGVTYDLMTDALGSTVGLYSGGITSHTYKYEPYGASTQTGSGNHPYRFTGREWDGAIGLQYNRARYYNPAWGRFMSEDPGGFLGSATNLYGYGGQDPINFRDPLGLEGGTGCGLAGFGCIARLLDQGFGSIVWHVESWLLGRYAQVLGADPRPCGNATCYDNSNFLVPPGANAWTFSHSIFCRDVCTPELLNHERVHVAQWDRTGLSYPVRYIYQAIVNGLNCENPWEAPAYQTNEGCS